MFGSLTYLFFSQLSVGGVLSILLVPQEAGKSFFRFCCAATLVLLAVGMAAGGVGTDHTLVSQGFFGAFGLTLVVFLLGVLRDRFSRLTLAASGSLGILALITDGITRAGLDPPWWAPVLGAAYSLTSALFIGSIIFGMVLGHWYLVLPTLPIDPLRDLTRLMILSVTVKAMLLVITLLVYFYAGGVEHQETISGFAGLGGLFFWARVLFGLLGPSVICYMTWETVKINSTQSATGLLYVATLLVLIGEPVSRFIYLTTSIPV